MTLQPFAGQGNQPVERSLPTHKSTQTQNKRTQTSIPRAGFEPTTPVFEWAKTVHALDRAASVISKYGIKRSKSNLKYYLSSCPEGQRKTTKPSIMTANLLDAIWIGPPENEVGVPSIQIRFPMKEMLFLLIYVSEMKLRTHTKPVGRLYSWSNVLAMLTVVNAVLRASVSSCPSLHVNI
jgi:hypothetical protein